MYHMILGNVGRDPEVRFTPGGLEVVSFSVAENKRKRNTQGGYDESVQWWGFEAWGPNADFVTKYVKKGSRVLVVGKNIELTYTDAAGQTVFLKTPKLTYVDLTFLPSSTPNPNGNGNGHAAAKPAAAAAGGDDDLEEGWISNPGDRQGVATGVGARPNPRVARQGAAAPASAGAAMWEDLEAGSGVSGDEIPF